MLTFKKIIFLLTSTERKNAFLLLLMILVTSILDMIGVASILPFTAVLMNPEIIETNQILYSIFKILNNFGIKNDQQSLFYLGLLVFMLLFVSLFFKALTTYVQTRFTYMREFSMGKRLVERYLHQSYDWFLNRHSADLGKTILSEVDQVISHGLNPLINLISQSTITFMLLFMLILIDPKLTIIILILIGLSYLIIYRLTRNFLTRIGKKRMNTNQERFTAVAEAFGAIKEIKINGLEKVYIERYSNPAKTYGLSQFYHQIVTLLPRFALEAIIFGGLLLIILYLMRQEGSFVNAAPVIALYAFAGYRMMPAIQQIYVALTSLRFVRPSLDFIYNEMSNSTIQNSVVNEGKILFKKEITLNDISYQYPNSSRTALKSISFKIPLGSTVGIVGVTGCGKTTTVDIILGLLEAQKGTLEVDGEVINRYNKSLWQDSIGYVPQEIYLTDDSISSNIAFGVNPKDIDKKIVEKVAKIANLHNFISNELPKKYQTKVGERGVRLSGGQRQRIGIARALYHQPKVIIFDEATSALDNLTERAVMDAVHNLDDSMTTILIAHRLSTVRQCDNIFLLEDGSLKDQGTYDKLLESNHYFRESVLNK